MGNDHKTCNNECSGCYTCQACNSCEKCDEGCETPCQSKQTFCKECQTYGEYESFSFSYSPRKDNIIGPGYFDQDVWDEIIEYINDLRTMGDKKSSGSRIALSKTSNVDPFKASEFNRIANYIADEDGNSLIDIDVSSGDVIYGSYFRTLEADVEDTELDRSACDTCNTGCQGCDSCELCNNSNSDDCGSGQKCDDWTNHGCQDACEHSCQDDCSDCDDTA